MLEWLFKYPRELFERGEIVFAPVTTAADGPVVLLAALLAITVSLVLPRRIRGLSRRRRLAIGTLQALFAAGIVMLLARPMVEVATLAPGANAVAVLVDVSESMGFADDGGQPRLQTARRLADDVLVPALSESSDVVTFVFGGGAERRQLVALEATRPRTHLLTAVGDVLASFRGTPLAAAVVISDGADNAPRSARREALERLKSAGVPVHTVGVGSATLPGEVQISEVSLPPVAPPESRVLAEVVLEHASSGPAAVKVYEGGRLVAVREVELGSGTTQRVSVAFDSGPGGIRELAFAVEPPPGDVLGGNNRQHRLLTVAERHRRVLYLEGEPRWEYKFIRRAMGGDAVVALTSWLRTTERKTYRQDVSDPEELASGFPDSRSALYRYDVVVLGSLGAAVLSDDQHQWLEDFVAERGGSVLALAGREALADGGWDVRPLADALPVQLSRGSAPGYAVGEGSVRPTAEGLRSPIVQLVEGEGADPWMSLPPLGDHQRLGALKPAATTLLEVMSGDEVRPLLVIQPYGLGTAAVLATSTSWRWRMRTPPDDQRHTLFWRQLLRQLGESAQQRRDLSLRVEDEAVDVRLVERDEAFAPRSGVRAVATFTGPGGRNDRLTLTAADAPGVLRGRYRAPEPGVYRIDVDVGAEEETVTRFVRVGQQRPEYFEPVQNDVLLRRLAEETGGRYWRPEEAGEISRALTFASAGVKRMDRYPLWDMPAAFLLLVMLKGGEWLLRRRWGRL